MSRPEYVVTVLYNCQLSLNLIVVVVVVVVVVVFFVSDCIVLGLKASGVASASFFALVNLTN